MNSNATVNMATILGIRRGELDEIIRVSLPAESLTVVEKRERISPCMSEVLGRMKYPSIDVRVVRGLRVDIDRHLLSASFLTRAYIPQLRHFSRQLIQSLIILLFQDIAL